MSELEIRSAIMEMFRTKPIMESLTEEDDFFDLGASSLTIVDLQLDVEQKLGVTVPTRLLMGQPTINGWVSVYMDKLEEAVTAA